jgi:DNA-binding MarR family transcriptional regulator
VDESGSLDEDRPLDEKLLRALGDEVLRIGSRRSTTYAGAQLETSAFRILWRLEERGPLTLRELADQLQLDQSTINRQVASATAHGLVERFEEPGNASRPVRPTEAGRAAYDHDGRLRAAPLARAIEDLGIERARAMVESLRAFNDAVDRAHDET